MPPQHNKRKPKPSKAPSPPPPQEPSAPRPARREREPARRPWLGPLALAGGLLLALAVLVGGVLLGRQLGPWRAASLPPTSSGPKRAAIVDQTALSHPNPELTRGLAADLTAAGFTVDTYTGKEVNIALYRSLASKGYRLIVCRTHSTNDILDTRLSGQPVYLFTSELYEKYRYVPEQMTAQIGMAKVAYEEESPPYFAIGPEFVQRSMAGQFDRTLLIIGGCKSLDTLALAQAFIAKGVAAVVGWNDWVDLSHNDQAIQKLVHALTAENLPLGQAVQETMAQVGPDPTYKSTLVYFPDYQQDYRVGAAGSGLLAADSGSRFKGWGV
jgi:hypothetical protein